MNIGILTLPLHSNYGGILQAYALQTFLERMGHDVVVFQNGYDGIRRFPIWRMIQLWGKRLLAKCIKGRKTPVFLEQRRKKELAVVNQKIQKFIKNNIHICNVNSLVNIPYQEFDVIVVGSDQIWRRDYACRIWKTDIQDVYLRFLIKDEKLKRIAYAVSFGKDQWDYTEAETKECAKLAQMFDGISVREDSGVELCLKHFGVNAKHVLDPTFLLSSMDYVDIINKSYEPICGNKHDGKLFAYILNINSEKKEIIERVSKERDIDPYYINLCADYSQPIEKRIYPSIESWLNGFYNAEMIITDSFHGCVFSIIFGKPFIALGNENRGMSRFLSLLKMCGLQDHLVLNSSDYNPLKSYNIPDESKKRLIELQSESRIFLKKLLQ